MLHWLPKSRNRQIVIMAFLLLRMGPKWPGVDELGAWKASKAYSSYLDEHTHYRDINVILESFQAAGFKTAHETLNSRDSRCASDFLKRNGFPGGNTTLITSKLSE